MPAPVQRSFACPACKATIYIPYHLAPTSAPCPHCRAIVTSPPLEAVDQSIPPKREIPNSIPAAIPHPVAVSEPKISTPSPKSSKTPWFVSAALLLLIVGGSWVFYQNFVDANTGRLDPVTHAPVNEAAVKPIYNFNWQTSARATLKNFLQATTLEEKARYVIGGQETLQRLRTQWGDQLLHEEPIREEDFAAIVIPDAQEESPTYLLMYQRPAQYDIKKFLRPLVTMEVMQGADSLDPLTSTLTNPANFELQPLHVYAYFKHTANGLQLDWDIYLQTRYRMLHQFAEKSPAGSEATFRVIAVQDVPLPEEKKMQRKIYRITDLAHITDSYRIYTPSDSTVAQQMIPIDWYQVIDQKAQFIPVTIVLKKMPNEELLLKSLICWDFEGLAGTTGNSLPQRTPTPSPLDAVSSPASPTPIDP